MVSFKFVSSRCTKFYNVLHSPRSITVNLVRETDCTALCRSNTGTSMATAVVESVLKRFGFRANIAPFNKKIRFLVIISLFFFKFHSIN